MEWIELNSFLQATGTVTINTNDVNDNAPTCTASSNAVVVDENEGNQLLYFSFPFQMTKNLFKCSMLVVGSIYCPIAFFENNGF